MISVDIGQMRDLNAKAQASGLMANGEAIPRIGEIQREHSELNQAVTRLDAVIADLINDIAPILSKPPIQKESAGTPVPPLATELGEALRRLRLRIAELESVVTSAITRVEL